MPPAPVINTLKLVQPPNHTAVCNTRGRRRCELGQSNVSSFDTRRLSSVNRSPRFLVDASPTRLRLARDLLRNDGRAPVDLSRILSTNEVCPAALTGMS